MKSGSRRCASIASAGLLEPAHLRIGDGRHLVADAGGWDAPDARLELGDRLIMAVEEQEPASNEGMADAGVPWIALINREHQLDAALRLPRVRIDVAEAHEHRTVVGIEFQQRLEYRRRVVDAVGKQVGERERPSRVHRRGIECKRALRCFGRKSHGRLPAWRPPAQYDPSV